LESQDHLFDACRILFGDEIELSEDFISYLQKKGVTSAFRKRAMVVHPDKALISGLSVQQCQREFTSLQVASETLLQHILSRDSHYRAAKITQKTSMRATQQPKGLPEKKLRLGRFLYRIGIIEWRQLIAAITWQKSSRPRIGELAISLGYLDQNSVVAILKNSIKRGAFGVTAYEMGLLNVNEVRELLHRQKRQQKKIGQFFIEKGILNRRELQEFLYQCNKHNRRVESISENKY